MFQTTNQLVILLTFVLVLVLVFGRRSRRRSNRLRDPNFLAKL